LRPHIAYLRLRGAPVMPICLLPIDVWHLSPAEPDDMGTLRTVEIKGEPPAERALRKVRTGVLGRA